MATDLRVSPDVLREADDGQLAWRVIAPAYDAVNIYDGPAALDADLAPLTPGQRALLALHWTVGEVCNGGFDQYFVNATGDLALEALAGLRRVGAAETAALLERVLGAFPGGPPPRDREARAEAMGALDDDARAALFEEFDERFYALMDAELYPRAAAYVRAHPEEFVLPR
jgi:hypothetical protein